jgi:23S rRNA (cytosine1962-C5)-methyltransferase
VSDETARAIQKGHPWILADDASDSVARFRPGTLIRVDSRAGGPLGWAHVEGDRRLAARVWAKGALSVTQIPSVEARVAKALARRRDLLVEARGGGTNVFRLIHGEGDSLPGLFVDRLGPLLRVLVAGRATDLTRERVIAALGSQLPLTPEGEPWSVLELLHLRGAGKSRFDRVRWVSGGQDVLRECDLELSDVGFQVLERGLRFSVDPGWETPRKVRPGYGLFVDQRENRARLAPHAARGGEWLNLFAHTGAFTASLLASGAERVTSVDLSAAYLIRLEENLVANADRGVDLARNESVRVDGRRFLETLRPDRRFAGIVLDPPTAAAAGHRFWSVRSDLEPLLRRCVERLDGGGVLLVTQNRSGPPLGLDRILERTASRAHRPIACLESAPAGSDHPSLPGFPEGEPFEGWLLRLD